MNPKIKIYCFNNSWSPGQPRHEWNIGIALSEQGVCITQHCSSSPEWCKKDITGPFKHEAFDKHCGKDNWEVIWIDDARNAEKHENIDFRTAVLLSMASQQLEDNRPNVKLEMSDGSIIEKKFE